MSEIPKKRDSGEESLKNSLKGDAARRTVRPELDGQKAAPRAIHSNDKASQRKPETSERPKATTAVDRARQAVRANLNATPHVGPSWEPFASADGITSIGPAHRKALAEGKPSNESVSEPTEHVFWPAALVLRIVEDERKRHTGGNNG